MSSKEFPSLAYYATSSYRITPIIITFLVIIIIAAISYYLLFRFLNRKIPCSTPPSAPKNVIAGYIDNRTFGVAWDFVGSADNYIVRISDFPNFTSEEAFAQFETNKLQLNVKNFDQGTTYYIKVAAENSCGTSPDSEGITYIFVET